MFYLPNRSDFFTCLYFTTFHRITQAVHARTPRCFFCSAAFLHTLRFQLRVSTYRVCFSSRCNNSPLYNFSPLCLFPHSFSARINRTYRPFAFCFSPRFLAEFVICCLFSFVSFCSKNFFRFASTLFDYYFFHNIIPVDFCRIVFFKRRLRRLESNITSGRRI